MAARSEFRVARSSAILALAAVSFVSFLSAIVSARSFSSALRVLRVGAIGVLVCAGEFKLSVVELEIAGISGTSMVASLRGYSDEISGLGQRRDSDAVVEGKRGVG